MKRICSLCLCLILLFTAAAVVQTPMITAAAATPAPEITASVSLCAPGETIFISFLLDNNPGIKTLTASLEIPQGWSAPTSQNGDAFIGMDVQNTYDYYWSGAAGDGDTLITYTFTVPANAAAGEYNVTLTPTEAIDNNDQPVTLQAATAVITVQMNEPLENDAKVRLTASAASAKTGESITVTVSLTDYPAAKSLMIKPAYDTSILEITDKQWVISQTNIHNFDGDKGVVAYDAVTDFNQTIASYTFTVKSGAALGETKIVFTVTTQNPDKTVASATNVLTVTCAHTYNQQIATAAYLKDAATCLTPATYYYSCACGAAGTTTFTSGAALGHNYVSNTDARNLKSAATCTQAATYYKSCSRCGATGTDVFTSGTTAQHSYVSKPDAKYLKSSATVSAAAVYYYSCSVCGVTNTDTFRYGTALRVGDADNDGTVDSDDAVYLLWYTFRPEQHPMTQSGDYNGDGKVDANDAVYLLWYTFEPAEYPLHAAAAD